jgi:hypothetical protein
VTAGSYTTRVDILGGSDATDEWGDPVEGSTVVFPDIPMSITETRQIVKTEGDPQAVAIHYYTARCPRRYPITSNHRVQDIKTGDIYSIDYVNRPTNDPTGTADTRLDLRRVT